MNSPIKTVGPEDAFLLCYNLVGTSVTHRKAKPIHVVRDVIYSSSKQYH